LLSAIRDKVGIGIVDPAARSGADRSDGWPFSEPALGEPNQRRCQHRCCQRRFRVRWRSQLYCSRSCNTLEMTTPTHSAHGLDGVDPAAVAALKALPEKIYVAASTTHIERDDFVPADSGSSPAM
jgi:hypothetical protein